MGVEGDGGVSLQAKLYEYINSFLKGLKLGKNILQGDDSAFVKEDDKYLLNSSF